MNEIEATHIIYEGPHRILKLLENIKDIFPEKLICIGKELTKINETILIDKAGNIIDILSKNKYLVSM
jgi:16S rRNA (cytidine1402-2'-O)-methyltransferase